MNFASRNISYRSFVGCGIVLVGIILYGHTLSFPFAYDCWTYIQNNPLIRSLKYFPVLADLKALVQLDEQLGLSQNVLADFMLRPLTYLTLSGNYLLHGLDPAGFRAVNIAIHILNAMMVFLLLERLLRHSPLAGNEGMFSARFISTLSAAMFLLHPLQTETVTYIMQRSSVLVTGFCLATTLLYLCSLSEQKPIRAWAFRWCSVIMLFLGMLVKESMFTVPLILLLLGTIVLGCSMKRALRSLMPHLLLLPVVPVLVLAAGRLEESADAVPAGALNIVNYSGYPSVHYAITQLCVVVSYLRLLLLPYGQNLDPDFPLYTSLLEFRPLASLMLLSLVISVSVVLYRRNRQDIRSSLGLFGVCWFFLGLAASSTVVPLPDLMAESRVYGASVGFFIVLAVFLDWLRVMCATAAERQLIVTAAFVLVAAYGVAAWGRNDVWRSNISLWQDTVAKSPGKVRPWHNLGMAFMDEMRFDEAISCFNRALRLNPSYLKSYEALVMSYTRVGRLNDAESTAAAGIKIAPGNAVLHNNLGVVYAESGRMSAARDAFAKALQLRPDYESARMNLERIMANRNRQTDSRNLAR